MKNNNPKNIYLARINRVINYINDNLNENLNLQTLADVANFSQFHFHRIFKSIIGESLYSFIKRLRLEKAANYLLQNNNYSITEIAYKCGFSSSANFAYAFKESFGISASEYKKNPLLKKSKISKTKSNNQKDILNVICYIDGRTIEIVNENIWRYGSMNVEVKNLPSFFVAYVRHIGPYQNCGTAWEKICQWAGVRNLFSAETKFFGLSYDNPEITPHEKCRYDACVTVPENTKPDGEVGIQSIEGGKYAVYRFEDSVDNIANAFRQICGQWMPDSGYQPDDKPCIEIYYNDCSKEPDRKCIADICIPVKPL